MSNLKTIADLCRTFNGQRYPAYANWLPAERVEHLRAAGVRCRCWRDVVYVHEDDHSLAGTALFLTEATPPPCGLAPASSEGDRE